MDETQPLGSFDLISSDDLKKMTEATGPKVSVFLPTTPGVHQPQDTATRIKSLLGQARRELLAASQDDSTVTDILAPLEALVTDAPFLRSQSDSLVLYASQGESFIYRLGLPLNEYVAVKDHFVLRPIAPVLTESHAFYVLALSQNKVRLFDATENGIYPLELGDDIPENYDEVIDPDSREKQLQHRPVGGGRAMFHGHGVGDEIDQIDREKFLKAVGEGLGKRLGKARSQPMVLASVAEVLPELKRWITYPVLLESIVPGNPDALSPADLHAAAWQVARARFVEQDDAAFERFNAVHGTGRGIAQPDQIRDAAAEGRVDTLFINPSLNASDGNGDVDRAILNTLNTSGAVVIISDGRVENVSALLRY